MKHTLEEIPGRFGNISEMLESMDPLQTQRKVPEITDFRRLTDLFFPSFSISGYRRMVRYVYRLSNHPEMEYHRVLIPKRNGGYRRLDVPSVLMKLCQEKILNKILSPMPVHPCAKAYVKGSRLRDAALPHVGKPVVVKLDIHDFYGSITFGMVYNRVFGEDRFPRKIGILLANLCCLRGVLPQGAPTSPAISNLVMVPLDEKISAWCEKKGITYTRYSDDLTFSGDFDPGELIGCVKRLLRGDGFLLNGSKTRIIRQGQRQTVTGVVVNRKAQLSSDYRRSIRQEVYYCKKYGVREHILHTGQTEYIRENRYSEDGKRVLQRRYLLHLLGRISYALMIDPDNAEMRGYRETVKELLSALPGRRFSEPEPDGLPAELPF